MKVRDWSAVDAVSLEVRQQYRYTYTGPVSNMRQRLVMVPPDAHRDQRLVSFELRVRGGAHTLTWDTDQFGNRVCQVELPYVAEAVTFDGRYRVERERQRNEPARFVGADFLEPTALTAPDARLEAVAAEIQRTVRTPYERAEAAQRWASTAIMYGLGVTGVRTPAAMALYLGKGVCQDFAHLLLCVLRLIRVPARYVSGQLMGDGATHAWVEALVDGEVIAYDPTHARRTRLDYVTVAVGRDYADVAPTSGVFTGSATGHLTSTRSARVVRVVADEAVA